MAALSSREFLVRLRGLSGEALFRDAMRKAPREIDSATEAQAVIARM